MLKKIKYFFAWLTYKRCEVKNIYSHKIVGQYQDDTGTLILYTILGKRDLYQMHISELMASQEMLSRFHPCQAAKLGAVALGDVLFSLPQEQREQKYNKIKKQMINITKK